MSACATGGKERGPWAFSPEHLTPPSAHQASTAAAKTAVPGHGPLCEASEHHQAEAAYRRATASLPFRLPKYFSNARFTNPSAEPTFPYTTSEIGLSYRSEDWITGSLKTTVPVHRSPRPANSSDSSIRCIPPCRTFLWDLFTS
ncbi:hypothetical protein NDU88_005127 [Pleurodeles waltl]|uniref:Uncharacterized protein n=1 Tax=Pleurodeles waltl TaxID=8319 RepID=A0AAV7QHC8_PLEWA|nr:hypothetical protein NDU88_005127 [Pleurodeles waltl]